MPVHKEKIRSLRERLGLTVEEAAKSCGLTRQGWHAVEAGSRIPRIDTLEKMAKALRVTVNDLLKK
jgi:putative transcriptional regulator